MLRVDCVFIQTGSVINEQFREFWSKQIKAQSAREKKSLLLEEGCCNWVSWSITQQVFALCVEGTAKARRGRGRSAATEPRSTLGMGLSLICPAVCSCIYRLCLLFPKQSEVRACVCVCVWVRACVGVCMFAVWPAEDWEFSVSVRLRILAGALLILSLLIPCCCSEGSKKIEALAMAAGT